MKVELNEDEISLLISCCHTVMKMFNILPVPDSNQIKVIRIISKLDDILEKKHSGLK